MVQRLTSAPSRLAVQLVHKVLHGLKTAHIRLEYDWVAMWTALVALGTFLVNKMDSLKSLPDIDNLVAQVGLLYVNKWR